MLPLWAEVLFLIAAAWAVVTFLIAGRSRLATVILIAWGSLHVLIASRGFYLVGDGIPPRVALFFMPTVIVLLALLGTTRGRAWMGGCGLMALTLVHPLRILVEIVLHRAFLDGQLPQTMTFTGTNFDILSGLSAPIVLLYLMRSKQPSRMLLIAWNLVCLCLLLNVVVVAALSVPSVMQQLNIDHPNLLVLHAPYVLLPALIVPVVLWSHVAALTSLLSRTSEPVRP